MEIVGDWGWSLLAYGFRRRSFEGKIVHEGMCNCLFVSFALPRELMPWRVWRRLISVGPDENLGSCLLFRERFSVFFSSLFFVISMLLLRRENEIECDSSGFLFCN